MIFLGLHACLMISLVGADLCPEPVLTNGQISGRISPDFFSGHVRCKAGFHLVGNPVIKCRAGTWSGTVPVCAAIGTCPTLPRVKNGRSISIRGSRESAVRFSCYRGFVLVGERLSHCMGESWSVGELPVCARATCEEGGMADIHYGEATREEGGAVYRYTCDEGVAMEGSAMVYCDGRSWNGTVPSCLFPPSAPELSILISGYPAETFIVPGYPILVSCQPNSGNPVPEVDIFLNGKLVTSNGTFIFEATTEDDLMDIECMAHTKAGRSETKRSVTVTKATILGPEQAMQGATVGLTCNLIGATQTPLISWIAEVEGSEDIEADVINEVMEEESGEATVNIKIDSDTGIQNLRVQCIASMEGLREIKSDIHEITVISPPSPPTLFGIRDGSDITVGEALLLTCSSKLEEDSSDSLVWPIDANVAGEGSEDVIDDGRVFSNWWFEPQMGESVVECRGSEERVAIVTFNVVDNDKGVTLETEDDYSFTELNDTMEDDNDNTLMNKIPPEQDYTDAVENVLENANFVTGHFIKGMLDANSAVEQNSNSKEATDHKTRKHSATATMEEEFDPTRSKTEPETEAAKVKDSALETSVKSSLVSIESYSSSNISLLPQLILIIFALVNYYN